MFNEPNIHYTYVYARQLQKGPSRRFALYYVLLIRFCVLANFKFVKFKVFYKEQHSNVQIYLFCMFIL